MKNTMIFQINQSFEICEERLSKVQKHEHISLVDYDLVNPYREKRNKDISDLYLWENDYLDLSFSIDKLYDDQTIIDLSMKMADLGDDISACHLAYIYLKGKDVKKDIEKTPR